MRTAFPPPAARAARRTMSRACSLFDVFVRAASRNPRPLASRRVVDPALRQIEPHVDRRVPLAVRQHAEHRDLTIVDLAQPPGPLPGHADRAIALFGEAALVDDQALVGLPPRSRSASRPICATTGSWSHGELLMKCWNCCAQPPSTTAAIEFERAVLRLRQPAQIAPRHRRVVARAGAEEMAIAVDEGRERPGDRLDQRYGQPSSAHTVT